MTQKRSPRRSALDEAGRRVDAVSELKIMTYNRLLLWLVTLMAGVSSLYFFYIAPGSSPRLGWVALIILLSINAYYYLFSSDWLVSRHTRKKRPRKR